MTITNFSVSYDYVNYFTLLTTKVLDQLLNGFRYLLRENTDSLYDNSVQLKKLPQKKISIIFQLTFYSRTST